jgi:hypothetical protein
MSPSDAQDPLLAAAAVLRDARTASPEALRAVIGAVARLYTASCEAAGAELCPVDRDIPTTEAMMLACAVVRSQNLNPFDFAMWFSSRGTE